MFSQESLDALARLEVLKQNRWLSRKERKIVKEAFLLIMYGTEPKEAYLMMKARYGRKPTGDGWKLLFSRIGRNNV